MPKEAVFTMKLEPQLRDEFMAAAEANHRPASQVVRELMREYVLRQQTAREQEDFLRAKVEFARDQIRKGQHATNEQVEDGFAARRASLRSRAAKAGK
jgi:hypothetical protein